MTSTLNLRRRGYLRIPHRIYDHPLNPIVGLGYGLLLSSAVWAGLLTLGRILLGALQHGS